MEYKLLPPVEKDSVYPLPPYFPNRIPVLLMIILRFGVQYILFRLILIN